MIDLTEIDETYRLFANNLRDWLPEGITAVDLKTLQSLGLTRIKENKDRQLAPITRHFHVIESDDKITLFNHQFLIWLVPRSEDSDIPATYAFIAFNEKSNPRLELVFETKGVYNTSKIVLDILERYLMEIQENERVLQDLAVN